jgi:hypothetical protein
VTQAVRDPATEGRQALGERRWADARAANIMAKLGVRTRAAAAARHGPSRRMARSGEVAAAARP